nr:MULTISPECIES: hypothetical protein [unclassified Ochrobactrum]
MLDRNSWDYMRMIEREFVRTLDFVSLSDEHAKVHSNEYAKLLLLAGSEGDNLMSIIASRVAGTSVTNVKKCQTVLCAHYSDFHTVEISIPRNNQTVQPFAAWAKKENAPDWWIAYNHVKHNRHTNFREANQENCMKAIAALVVLNLYKFGDCLEPYTELFDPGYPQSISTSGSINLPGFVNPLDV